MAKRSAGLIMYRGRESHLEVFLVHPGGPFWAKKDKGAWSITQSGGKIVIAWAVEAPCPT
jgi:predicted NUDIX family NTP pyrophosphohydrolase